jgi:tRNA 2-thiouridine synthesizing protein E
LNSGLTWIYNFSPFRNLKYKLFMATIEIDGKVFDVDGDGFLSTPELWTEDVAKLFAKYDGIPEMNEKHWSIVKIIRRNWVEKGMAPMIRTICQETGIKLRDIYELFPLGPARGACRVAGLPKPDGCV